MRLIDADALYNKYQETMTRLLSSTNIENISAEAISLLCGSTLIREAPIIPALPGACLLTLEEASKRNYVWIEITPHFVFGPRRIEIVPIDTTACMIYSFQGAPQCRNTCNYGKSWRCWSNKPTLEQMKEVEWDEN